MLIALLTTSDAFGAYDLAASRTSLKPQYKGVTLTTFFVVVAVAAGVLLNHAEKYNMYIPYSTWVIKDRDLMCRTAHWSHKGPIVASTGHEQPPIRHRESRKWDEGVSVAAIS